MDEVPDNDDLETQWHLQSYMATRILPASYLTELEPERDNPYYESASSSSERSRSRTPRTKTTSVADGTSTATADRLLEVEEQGQPSDQVVPAQAPAPPSDPTWTYRRLWECNPEETGHNMVYFNTATKQTKGDGGRSSADGR